MASKRLARPVRIPAREARKRIKRALERRSGHGWEVQSGGVTSMSGWIRITSPKSRTLPGAEHVCSHADRCELHVLLGLDDLPGPDGVSVPPWAYREFINRAEAGEPGVQAGAG